MDRSIIKTAKNEIIYLSELKAAYRHDLKASNGFILNRRDRKAEPNHVNLHRWIRWDGEENLGDYLSYIVVEYMKQLHTVDDKKLLNKTKHLYAAGSILSLGLQNAVVWGSGYLYDVNSMPIKNVYDRVERRLQRLRTLDIRCVRGPETRRVLCKQGFKCPEIYGDPALLMPHIYQPEKCIKTRRYSVVRHWCDNSKTDNNIPILTTDYKDFIDKLVSSELVVSSSLHGIILAESYGVPAVLYIPTDNENYLDEFKYRDYYYSTERYEFPVAKSAEEALQIKPCELPDLKPLQDNLLKTFPIDIWR